MKIHRTTRLFRGQLDLAPFLCVLVPLALVTLLQGYLVLPRGTRVKLPSSDSGPVLVPGEKTLILAVDSHRRLFFENQVMASHQLEEALSRRVRQTGVRVLLIQADETVPYGDLTEIARLARKAGMEDAILGTLPPLAR